MCHELEKRTVESRLFQAQAKDASLAIRSKKEMQEKLQQMISETQKADRLRSQFEEAMIKARHENANMKLKMESLKTEIVELKKVKPEVVVKAETPVDVKPVQKSDNSDILDQVRNTEKKLAEKTAEIKNKDALLTTTKNELAVATESLEKERKVNAENLTKAGERIANLLKSEKGLKQQLASKDRVLLQMNSELFMLKSRKNSISSDKPEVEPVEEEAHANLEGRVDQEKYNRLNDEVCQLREDKRRLGK